MHERNISTSVLCVVWAGLGLLAGCQSPRSLPPGRTIRAQLTVPGSVQDSTSTEVYLSVPPSAGKQRSFPLVVVLHGYGDHAAAFHELWKPAADSLGVVLLAPLGDKTLLEGLSYAWADHAEPIILAGVDMTRRLVSINPHRIYLAGFSQGGNLAYRIGLAHPELFRGIAPLGARFRSSFLPDSCRTRFAMRIYIGHGDRDQGINASREAAALLQSQGHTVRLEIYRRTGHDIPEPREREFIQIIRFLMDQ